jgi:hypothetical protein
MRQQRAGQLAGRAPAEGAKAEPVLQFCGMTPAGLARDQVVVDGLWPDIDLFGDKRDQRGRRSLIDAQGPSRIAEIAKHQRVAEATVIAATPPNHSGICLAQCAVTHQLTPIGRWIEQRGDLGFGQLLSAHHSYPLHVETGRPADPRQEVDEGAALDAEGAANRGLGGAAVERRDHPQPLRQSVLVMSAYATKMRCSLVPAVIVTKRRIYRLAPKQGGVPVGNLFCRGGNQDNITPSRRFGSRVASK